MCNLHNEDIENPDAELLLEDLKQSLLKLFALLLTPEKNAVADYKSMIEICNIKLLEMKSFLVAVKCKSKYGASIIDCITNAIKELNNEICLWNTQAIKLLVQYTLQPLLIHMQRDLSFWLSVYGDRDAMAAYREAQVDALKLVKENLPKRQNEDFQYDVTIAVTAYNKCDFSRLAVESILKHTDFSRYRVELILIDNGSTDETIEFFRSVKNVKSIHLTQPLGYPATSLGAYASHGKYYVHFANDIIATPHWLENLLACMEHQPSIGMVVPACNYMSSFQSISAVYQDPMEDRGELDAFAEEYNKSHDNTWEERTRLLPCMSIMPSTVAKQAANDCLFYFGEFADDDVSTRLRRAGLRQIYDKGTFVHHFGSVTAGTAQSSENSLGVSRKLYREKWGIDAWSSWDWEYELVDTVIKSLPAKQIKCLWIDPEFCALPIQARDRFNKLTGQQMELVGAVTDKRYIQDALGVLDNAVSGDLQQCLAQLLGETFDVIVFRRDIGMYIDQGVLQNILLELKPLLNSGGKIVFYSLNAQVFYPLNQLLIAATSSIHGEHLVPTISLFPEDVSIAAQEVGFSADILPAEKSLTTYCKNMLAKIININQQVCNRNIFVLTNQNESKSS